MGKFSDYEYRKQPGTGHTSGVNSIFSATSYLAGC
jgi:hypothetical protein